jgi:hypothetical protein
MWQSESSGSVQVNSGAVLSVLGNQGKLITWSCPRSI